MKFNIMGLIILVIAILAGNYIGPMIGGYFGATTGILGTLLTGFLIYIVWALLTGQKINIMTGAIFVVGVWISSYALGYISTSFGAISGWMLTFVQAIVLSIVLSFIRPTEKLPVKL